MKKIALILVSGLLILATYYAYPKTGSVKIVRVIDGDTIEAENYKRIRILGIDTPEVGEPKAREATDFMNSLVLGKRVEISCWKKDKYNRDLCYVYLDNIDISKMVIVMGYSNYIKPY